MWCGLGLHLNTTTVESATTSEPEHHPGLSPLHTIDAVDINSPKTPIATHPLPASRKCHVKPQTAKKLKHACSTCDDTPRHHRNLKKYPWIPCPMHQWTSTFTAHVRYKSSTLHPCCHTSLPKPWRPGSSCPGHFHQCFFLTHRNRHWYTLQLPQPYASHDKLHVADFQRHTPFTFKATHTLKAKGRVTLQMKGRL